MHREAGVRVSSADWLKAGVARQRVGPISLGIAPRACTILSKLLLLLLLLRTPTPLGLPIGARACAVRVIGMDGIIWHLPAGQHLGINGARQELLPPEAGSRVFHSSGLALVLHCRSAVHQSWGIHESLLYQ